MITRRGLLTGLSSLIAAPAIVRATSLMPVVPVTDTVSDILARQGWVELNKHGGIIRVAWRLVTVETNEVAAAA